MKILELFSGTHSIGKVCKEYNYEVISLDKDLDGKCKFDTDYDNSKNHIKEDIMTWNYKIYPSKHFNLITASPVCLWWSCMRRCVIDKDTIEEDINKYGKPMVDKLFEIIEYFKPNFWWIENPQTGLMKKYIESKYPQYNTYYDFDYCKYSNWGYQKRTRFWTNIKNVKPKLCKKDCENIINGRHKINIACNEYVLIDNKKIFINTKELREQYKEHEKYKTSTTKNKYERYRIPESIIKELLDNID